MCDTNDSLPDPIAMEKKKLNLRMISNVYHMIYKLKKRKCVHR